MIPEGHWKKGMAVVTGELPGALSNVAVGCQSSPSLHPYTLFTQQQHLCSAWGLDPDYLQSPACSPRFRFQRGLLIHFLYSGCKWQIFFFFGFKVFSLEPFSLSALKLVCLITSTFWNWKPCRSAFILLKPSQFVANRLGLSDHKQLLLQHPHYLPKVSCRITSRLLSACFVQRSVGSYIPDLQSPTVGICSSF